MQKKCFGTEEITPLNKIKAKFKKNLRTRRGNIAYGNTFLFIIGRANKRTLFRGNQICTMEARMFIDLIQYYFSASWERICVGRRILFRARPNWETFCRKKVHQSIAMQAVEIQKMITNREDEKK